jgi:hypothetical protein
MKLEKDWLSYIVGVIPAFLCLGIAILFQQQNFWVLFIGLLLLYVVIGRTHYRVHKLNERVEELEARLSQIRHTPV